MTAVGSISPCFITRDVRVAAGFYVDRLGFEIACLLPEAEPFFAIVRRGGGQIFLKAIDVEVGPLPNSQRHPWARWDAYIGVADPDALAAEYGGRGVTFSAPLADTNDGLRGFELKDADGYVLFFGRPREQDETACEAREEMA